MNQRIRTRVRAAVLAIVGQWRCCRCGDWQQGDIPPRPQVCDSCK
ncbi:hypothetical protein ACFVUW_30020 [Streptomyces xiamenensis]